MGARLSPLGRLVKLAAHCALLLERLRAWMVPRMLAFDQSSSEPVSIDRAVTLVNKS